MRPYYRIKVLAMELFIIPSMHISKDNKALVRHAFECSRPDAIAVELCPQRYASLVSRRKPGILDYALNPMFTVLFIAQQALGFLLGSKPGLEMAEGIETAKNNGLMLILADIPIQQTVACVNNCPMKEKLGLLFARPKAGSFSINNLEALKDQANLGLLLDYFRGSMPNMYDCVIGRRDRHIFNSVLASRKNRVLLIIGAGHLQGILRLIREHNIKAGDQISYSIIDSETKKTAAKTQ